MSALTDAHLTDRAREPSWYLQIAGFPFRFYNADAPPVDADYTDVRTLAAVDGGGSTLEPLQGRVKGQPARVAIVDNDRVGGGATAARDLRRLNPEGADRRWLLLTTIPATGAVDVEVTTDNSTAPAAGYLWIDGECIAYTGTAGTGGPGDPWRFTGTTRGALGSQLEQHLVDAGQGWQPWVTSHCVSWRTRPAVLWLRATGGTAWVQWVAGFIDDTTAIDGHRLEVRVVPWDAALDTEVGGTSLACGLVHGWQLLQVGRADQISNLQIWRQGEAVDTIATAATAAGAGLLNAPTGQYADVFDVTLPLTSPRHPAIAVLSGIPPAAMTPTALPGPLVFTVPPADPSMAVNAGEPVVNVETQERYTATIDASPLGTEVLKRWPEDYLDAINAAWAPATNKGATGAWCDVQIHAFHQTRLNQAASLKLNSTKHAGSLEVVFRADALSGRGLVYPIRLDDPSEDEQPAGRRRAASPMWKRTVEIGKGVAGSTGRTVVPIKAIAAAWYQYLGTPAILIDRLTVSIGTEYLWEVRWTDLDQTEHTATFFGTVTAAVLSGGTTIGYRLEPNLVDGDPPPSFGDWPGLPRAMLRPVAAWRGEDPRGILVKLLMSIEGNGANGVYDAYPHGARVPAAFVDVDQIYSYPVPAQLTRWTHQIGDAVKLGEVVEPMLRAMGAALQMHLDAETGLRKLRLVPVGRAAASESVATLDAGDWSIAPTPTATDDEIANAFSFTLLDDQGRETVARWVYRDSVRAHGGEARTMEIDLQGLRADLPEEPANVAAALRGVFGELAAAHGWPRRTFSGGARQPSILHVDAGDVVTVTGDDLVGFDGSVGVGPVPMRVRSVRHDVEDGRSEVTLEYLGGRGAGWAPSLRVAVVVGANVVDVDANACSDAAGPTGAVQEDLDFWAAGDDCMPVPTGAWAGVSRNILAIDRALRRVTLDGPHGLAVGDFIDTMDYDAASTLQRGFAFLADAALELGAAGDPARTYS